MWVRVEYIAMAFYPFLIMWFAREYVGERRFANRYVMGILLCLNIITLFFVQDQSITWLVLCQSMGGYQPWDFPSWQLTRGSGIWFRWWFYILPLDMHWLFY